MDAIYRIPQCNRILHHTCTRILLLWDTVHFNEGDIFAEGKLVICEFSKTFLLFYCTKQCLLTDSSECYFH